MFGWTWNFYLKKIKEVFLKSFALKKKLTILDFPFLYSLKRHFLNTKSVFFRFYRKKISLKKFQLWKFLEAENLHNVIYIKNACTIWVRNLLNLHNFLFKKSADLNTKERTNLKLKKKSKNWNHFSLKL